jgi:hypothetical protein
MNQADFSTIAVDSRRGLTSSHSERESLGWFLELAP